MFKARAVLIAGIILLQGCSGSSVKQQKSPNVTSNPSGATVYANMLEIGKTPLSYNLYDAFPAGWENFTYQAQGVLVVKKDGCIDFVLKVTDFILSKPIHAELKCDDVKTPVKLAPAVKFRSGSESSGAEKRLEELEVLYKKGVITKDEYKTTRERILSDL